MTLVTHIIPAVLTIEQNHVGLSIEMGEHIITFNEVIIIDCAGIANG